MDNPFDAMCYEVQRAQELNRAVDAQVNNLLSLIDGRLRNADTWRLKRLKAQLSHFNAHTGEWKD